MSAEEVRRMSLHCFQCGWSVEFTTQDITSAEGWQINDSGVLCPRCADGWVPAAARERDKALAQRDYLRLMLRQPHCSQCGQGWAERACGPTHAVIYAALDGEDDDE